MRKIIVLFILAFTLFANDGGCKLDVYFGNGVWNTKKQAIGSMKTLKKFMQTNDFQRFSVTDEGVTYDFKYAHNETYGYVNDLLENFWQLYESGQISELYFSFIANALDGIDNTNPNREAFVQRIQNIIAQYQIDAAKMYAQYQTESFSKNHTVLLVAHSQGNLFGNKMYELQSADEKKKFQMVSVATPADHVPNGVNYTTLDYDLVIKAISGSLPANANGFGHTFVDSYLNVNNIQAISMIDTAIDNAISTLDQNTCQKYLHYRWIGYICPSRSDTELEVDIYGSRPFGSGGMTMEELVATETRGRIALNAQGQCPINGWDYITDISRYDKNGCSAYIFDDTSGNFHSLDYIAAQTYDNDYICAEYKLSKEVYEKLKALQQ